MSQPIPSSSSSKADYDPRLDFYSDQFDPLLALHTPNLKPPCPSAKTLDNLEKYNSTQKRLQNLLPQREPHTKPQELDQPVEIQRAWEPHQLPISSKKKTKNKKDIFTRMESIQGPLSYLRECANKRTQIKVTTRTVSEIRGYCLGFLVLFDKHWNLVLEDVTEVWTRRKKRKLLPIPRGLSRDSIKKPADVVIPKLQIIATTKKTETCQRRIARLLIRGEQIAVISVNNS